MSSPVKFIISLVFMFFLFVRHIQDMPLLLITYTCFEYVLYKFTKTTLEEWKWLSFKVLNPFQIIIRLTFLTSRVWPLVLFKKLCKISVLLSWLGLLIKVLKEWLKFDYVCITFLNKMSGQIWSQKIKRLIIWDGASTCYLDDNNICTFFNYKRNQNCSF